MWRVRPLPHRCHRSARQEPGSGAAADVHERWFNLRWRQVRSEVPDLTSADKGLLLEMDTLDELALKELLAPAPPATLERAARSRLTHAQEAHQACDRVHRELCGAWGELQSLLERHQLMTSKSQHLRDACSSRSLTQQQQAAWLGELEAAMEHFRQMERATKLLATESVGPSTVCSEFFLDGIAQVRFSRAFLY